MKKHLYLFCFLVVHLSTFAQTESFEGVLVYGRKFYNNSKRVDTYDPNIPPTLSYTVKGGKSLAEIITEKDFMTAMNYSVIMDSEKKEAVMLASIANQKMAVKFEPSYFNPNQLSKVVSANEERTRIIAGLTCKLGYAITESEFGVPDTMRVWYTTALAAVPYQFETLSSPGLIVSMQQDDVSYWELKEIQRKEIDPNSFVIPKEYFPMSQSELQDFIATMDQLKIEEEEDPMEKRGNEINREVED